MKEQADEALIKMFQHAAARRRLERKARHSTIPICFNTQPPEGGWAAKRVFVDLVCGFNTQPPEGGW